MEDSEKVQEEFREFKGLTRRELSREKELRVC